MFLSVTTLLAMTFLFLKSSSLTSTHRVKCLTRLSLAVFSILILLIVILSVAQWECRNVSTDVIHLKRGATDWSASKVTSVSTKAAGMYYTPRDAWLLHSRYRSNAQTLGTYETTYGGLFKLLCLRNATRLLTKKMARSCWYLLLSTL